MDIGVDPAPPTPQRATVRPKIDCGPAPLEPAWSAWSSPNTPGIVEIPADQWRDIAHYMGDVRDWRDCLALAAERD